MKSIAEEIFRIEHNGNNEWKIQKKRAFQKETCSERCTLSLRRDSRGLTGAKKFIVIMYENFPE